MKKENVYIMPIDTEKNILKAEKLQAELYNKFDSVKVFTTGLCEIKIVAS